MHVKFIFEEKSQDDRWAQLYSQVCFIHQQPDSLSIAIAPEICVQGEELVVTLNVYNKKTKTKQHINKTRDDLHGVHKVPSELVQLEQKLVI